MSEQVLLSSTTQPNNPILYAPRVIIYDPGKCLSDPVKKLDPYNSFVEICFEEKDLIHQLANAQNANLCLLLILFDKNNLETKAFLDQHIPNQAHLNSLHLIFSNGTQFHDKWFNTESMPKLRWCRSYTKQICEDILHFCQTSCNTAIEFYQQQMRIAQDAVDCNESNASRGLVRMYAAEARRLSLLQARYLAQIT